MARDPSRRLARLLKGIVLASLLSLASGYVLFLAVFPTVAFPPSGAAPVPLILIILAVTAFVVGFAAEDLLLATLAATLSPLGGVLVAGLMGLFPLAQGLFLMDPGSMPAFLVHYGFVFILLSFTVNIVAAIVGYGARERYIVQRPQSLREPFAAHRK